MSCESIIEFRCFNPRRNLPPSVGSKRGEANFVGAFERGFTAGRAGRGVGGRHFAMSGYGIADFVWAEPGTGKGSTSKLTAFEMKLRDWRRALTQAYRYSYFADASIVVLPVGVADKAEEHLHVFERLGIGLWSCDPNSERIDMRFTPKGTHARNPAAREKALGAISRKVKFRKLGKQADAFL